MNESLPGCSEQETLEGSTFSLNTEEGMLWLSFWKWAKAIIGSNDDTFKSFASSTARTTMKSSRPTLPSSWTCRTTSCRATSGITASTPGSNDACLAVQVKSVMFFSQPRKLHRRQKQG